MMLKLKVECMQGAYLKEPCVRIIVMDDSASLLDLHDEIQDAVDFGRDHPFEFYTANSASQWARRHWITYVEEWDEKEAVFGKTKLRDIWPLGRKKLYYWFDFGDRWIFEIRKMRFVKEDEALSAPCLVERIGPDPLQYPIVEE